MPGAEFDMAEPFASMAALKNQRLLVPESNTHFCIERNFLVSIMAKRLATIKFDEAWYLSKYPDVKDAVRRGVLASAALGVTPRAWDGASADAGPHR